MSLPISSSKRRFSAPASAAFVALSAAALASCSSQGETSVGRSQSALSGSAPLVNTLSGLCLDSKGANTTPGQRLQIYPCHDASNERFSFTAAGELRVFDGSVCVEPQDRVLASGKQVVLAASCDGSAGQRWQLNADHGISSTSSPNLCFDLSGGALATQTPIVLSPCSSSGSSQAWSTSLVSPPPPSQPPPSGPAVSAPILSAAAADRCLDIKGANSTPGQRAQIYTCNGQTNQSFASTPAGELRVFGGTRCLEPQAGSAVAGSQIISANCTGLGAQQWRLNADGSISAPGSNLCFDLTGGSTAIQTPLVLATCNGAVTQRWTTSSKDTQAPTVPGNPTLSNVTCNSATLSWSSSTDDLAVIAYDVYHDGQLMKSVAGTTLSTSIVLVAGASWNVYVNARDASGNVSQGSAIVPIKVPQCQVDTQAPSQPQALTGSASGTSVNLSWSASTDNVAVTAYDVYRANVKVGSTASTSFADSGLSPATTYAYYVVARDAQANLSAPSSTLSVTTGAGCASHICSVTQIGSDTDIPWGLVTLADGTILYTRRDADDIAHLDSRDGSKDQRGHSAERVRHRR